jgi:hypothetical protein
MLVLCHNYSIFEFDKKNNEMKKNNFLLSMMIVLLFSSFTINSSKAQLYINEFMAGNNDALPGPQGDYPDWIEIYNAGTEAVMLGGYYLCDTLDISLAYMIPDTHPDSVTVAAGGYMVFYANKSQETSVFNLDFRLNDSGEQIGLWAPDQTALDEITFSTQIADISFGRYPDGSETWFPMVNYTPGASNTNPEIPPLDANLYINEFMASNNAALPGPQGDFPDWIEIYNAGTEAVNLGGYYLCDTLDITRAYMIPNTHPDSVTVAAGGHILFYANNSEASSVLNLDFKLSGDGEQIGFWAPDLSVIDTLSYTEQFADTSYGRYPDGSETWFLMPNFTPGTTNQSVAINEIKHSISDLQNSPNPFCTETNIQFTLINPDKVSIRIFDAGGSLVKVIADGNFAEGTHSIMWNASDLKAGYYFYTLQSSTGILSNKAVVIK